MKLALGQKPQTPLSSSPAPHPKETPTVLAAIRQGMNRRKGRNLLVMVILALVMVALVVLNLTIGNTTYSLQEVWQSLSNEGSKNALFTIRSLRVPRICAALLAGMAFGVSGSILQKMLHNPLASPDIIGVTAGSSVAAVFGLLIMHFSGWIISLMAVAGGIVTTALIYGLAHSSLSFSNARLILIGLGMQAFLNSLISWMLQLSSEYNVLSAMRWISGSLNQVEWSAIPFMAVSILTCLVLSFILSRHLDILQLGESFATTLGSRPEHTRLYLLILSVCLSAFTTAVTGPIAAVAFLSGPIAARLCKTGTTPLAASAFTGACLVLLADWIAQYALPVRYPVGVITGILGAPYLLLLLFSLQHKKS